MPREDAPLEAERIAGFTARGDLEPRQQKAA